MNYGMWVYYIGVPLIIIGVLIGIWKETKHHLEPLIKWFKERKGKKEVKTKTEFEQWE